MDLDFLTKSKGHLIALLKAANDLVINSLWHKADECLPEMEGTYLVRVQYGMEDIGDDYGDMLTVYWDGHEWDKTHMDFEAIEKNVTHWLDLSDLEPSLSPAPMFYRG